MTYKELDYNKKKEMIISGDDVRFLAEIGFLGLTEGMFDISQKIFNSLCELRPEDSFAYIGIAMNKLLAGFPDQAIDILQKKLVSISTNKNEIMLYLAFCYANNERINESRNIIYQLLNLKDLSTSQVRFAKAVLKNCTN